MLVLPQIQTTHYGDHSFKVKINQCMESIPKTIENRSKNMQLLLVQETNFPIFY